MSKSRDAARFAHQISRFYASGTAKKGQSSFRNVQAKPTQSPAPKNPVHDALKSNKDAEVADKAQAPAKPVEGTGEALSTGRVAGPSGAATLQAAGGSPPTDKSRWQFSPALPVDVRILAAGTLAFGGFVVWAYYRKVEEVERQVQDSQASSAPESTVTELPGASTGEEIRGRGLADDSNFYTEELALEAGKAGQESLEEAAGSRDTGGSEADGSQPAPSSDSLAGAGSSTQREEEASGGGVDGVLASARNNADTEVVAELLQSVLTGQIDLQKAEVEESRLQAPLADSGSTASSSDGGASEGGAAESPELAAAGRKRVVAEKKLQETLDVLKEGVAATSGEAMLSSAASQAKVSLARHASEQSIPQAASTPAWEVPPEELKAARERLGIAEDLQPAALIRKAIERGEGSGDNWTEYSQRLLQAAADAKTFHAAIKEAISAQEGKFGRLKAESDSKDRLVSILEHTIRDQATTFQEILQQEEEIAARQREGELKRQAEYMATAFAEAALKERSTRLQSLDDVRVQLNSLHEAFGRRSQEQATSHGLHKLSLGLFALEAALETGEPFAAEVRALQESCPDDPLVAAAIASLPEDGAEKGLPTRTQLVDRWSDVRRLSSTLTYLPATRPGLVQLGLAALAAQLKVKEVAQAGEPQTVDQALAHAEASLLGGKLSRATSVLEKMVAGTAAESVVSAWSAEVKARAVAEQAVRLLQAHASSKEASVS